MTTKFLYDFIAGNEYAVLSTVTADHQAEAALVGIAVTADLRIIFDTSATSRKYHNLMKNPSIAFVIGWKEERTIQYEGRARIPHADELDELLETYFRVFPEGRERKENMKDIAYFVVEPKWIRYADFNSPPRVEEQLF